MARAGRLPGALVLIPAALAVAADPDVAIFARAYGGYREGTVTSGTPAAIETETK